MLVFKCVYKTYFRLLCSFIFRTFTVNFLISILTDTFTKTLKNYACAIQHVQVKDLKLQSDSRDVDFVASSTEVSLSWANVFVDLPGAMDVYKIALGTDPGGKTYFGLASQR